MLLSWWIKRLLSEISGLFEQSWFDWNWVFFIQKASYLLKKFCLTNFVKIPFRIPDLFWVP